MNAIADAIDFETFAAFRRKLLDGGKVLDVAETAMARVLEPYRPRIRPEWLRETAHRCHVAGDWLVALGMPSGLSRNALVSTGVRDGLQRLFRWMGSRGMRVAIPSDVYPAYGRLARSAGIEFLTYDGYPSIDVGALGPCDAILVCNPMKPRGHALSEAELDGLTDWLAGDVRRRVIVDAVYTFGDRFDRGTLRLLDTGRAWLLHSLAKGWAHPGVLGIALAPDADMGEPIVSDFRGAEADRHALAIARALLQRHAGFPESLQGLFSLAEGRMRDDLAGRGVELITVPEPTTRYLFTVRGDWRELLGRGVLAIPFSVFGRPERELSVASSLRHLP